MDQITNRPNDIKYISKFMAYLLRHGTEERSINIDSEGYILLDDLLKQPEMKQFSVTDIIYVVDNNDKKRYKIIEKTNNGYGPCEPILYIRANQGHSKDIGSKIDDESLLTKLETSVPICIHGTDKKSWGIIKSKGLSPMLRKHIHLASGLSSDDTVISGIRKSAKVLIYIDMDKALQNGKTFYLSTNGVILTPDNLEPEYFKKVEFI
jgi:2'-phosphotransferase